MKKPCKCGATTHSLPTSKLCKLNKKYNRFEANKLAVKRRVMAGAAARRAAVAAAAAVANRETESTTEKPAAEVEPIVPPEPVRQQFQVGDNVNAEWRRGQWFLGHVTGFDDGRYTVYFLFGKVKSKLQPSKVRESDSSYPKRSELIGKDFFFDGAEDLPEGTWRVRQLLNQENMYKCTRLTGVGLQNVEKFDIGYVIKQYVKGLHDRRESGLGTVLSRGRRSSGITL